MWEHHLSGITDVISIKRFRQFFKGALMQQPLEFLNALFKKELLGDQKVKPFPAQRNEIQAQQRRHRAYAGACICLVGKDFEPYVHVAVDDILVSSDFVTVYAGTRSSLSSSRRVPVARERLTMVMPGFARSLAE